MITISVFECHYLNWEAWSSCSVTCGNGGTKTRERDVLSIDFGQECNKTMPTSETIVCDKNSGLEPCGGQ